MKDYIIYTIYFSMAAFLAVLGLAIVTQAEYVLAYFIFYQFQPILSMLLLLLVSFLTSVQTEQKSLFIKLSDNLQKIT